LRRSARTCRGLPFGGLEGLKSTRRIDFIFLFLCELNEWQQQGDAPALGTCPEIIDLSHWKILEISIDTVQSEMTFGNDPKW
jgi:hypothetical protein